MGRVKKLACEPATRLAEKPVANPVPGDDGAALERIVAFFRQEHPEAWETHKLCPLQHGLDAMVELLRGRG